MSDWSEGLPATAAKQDTMPCPYCGEEIKVDAKKCRFCGEWLTEEHSASAAPNGVVGVIPISDATTAQPLEAKGKRQRPKLGAGLIGGFLAGFLSYFIISTMSSEPQMWAFWVGWVVFGLIFMRSGWPTVWANLSIMSFLWPVAVFIFGATTTSTYSSDAEQAGAAVGTFLVTGIAGFAGFFFGIMFALLALFTRRSKDH